MKHFFLFPGMMHSVRIDPDKEPAPSDEIPEPLYPYEHDINTSDGGEFLDDNLRMKEQPLEVRMNVTVKNEDINKSLDK